MQMKMDLFIDKVCICHRLDGLWYLTPLSTIFQLYRYLS